MSNGRRKPDLFILGAPKAGTTTVHDYLSRHEAVFMSTPKEPHFFSQDLRHGPVSSMSRYEQLFAAATDNHIRVGESSVFYLYSEVAVKLILEYQPDARFIVMLRNPIDVSEALYAEEKFASHEDAGSFEEAWRLQDERRWRRRVPKACQEPKLLLYGSVASEGHQLRRLYETVRDRGRVHTIFLDDLRSQEFRILENLCTFLEVSFSEDLPLRRANARKEHRSAWARQVIRMTGRAKTALGINLGTGAFARMVDWNKRPGKREAISPAFRQELCEYFRPDILLLSELTDRDLSRWLNTPPNLAPSG